MIGIVYQPLFAIVRWTTIIDVFDQQYLTLDGWGLRSDALIFRDILKAIDYTAEHCLDDTIIIQGTLYQPLTEP